MISNIHNSFVFTCKRTINFIHRLLIDSEHSVVTLINLNKLHLILCTITLDRLITNQIFKHFKLFWEVVKILDFKLRE